MEKKSRTYSSSQMFQEMITKQKKTHELKRSEVIDMISKAIGAESLH